MSYEHYGISDHWQLKCLYNSLIGLTSNKLQKFALLAPCEGNPVVRSGFPVWVRNAYKTYHDVIIRVLFAPDNYCRRKWRWSLL